MAELDGQVRGRHLDQRPVARTARRRCRTTTVVLTRTSCPGPRQARAWSACSWCMRTADQAGPDGRRRLDRAVGHHHGRFGGAAPHHAAVAPEDLHLAAFGHGRPGQHRRRPAGPPARRSRYDRAPALHEIGDLRHQEQCSATVRLWSGQAARPAAAAGPGRSTAVRGSASTTQSRRGCLKAARRPAHCSRSDLDAWAAAGRHRARPRRRPPRPRSDRAARPRPPPSPAGLGRQDGLDLGRHDRLRRRCG